jgi:amino acid transporter
LDHDNEARGEALLAKHGYRQELDRALTVLSAVGLSLSDITPTASFFVITAAIYPLAGTGSFWTFLIAGIVALSVAMCMGELGSQYPIAGGLYSIVARVLGRPVGFIAMVDYVFQAIFLPVAVAIGIGGYMSMLVPAVNPNLWGTIIMVICTVLAALSVRTNADITGVFLAIELIVIVTVTVLGITHPHNSLQVIMAPHLVTAHGTVAVGMGAILSSVAIGLFSYNGYDSAINFSEETKGSARNVGRTVFTAALLGVVFQVIPAIAVLLGVIGYAGFFSNSLPIAYFLHEYLGTTGTNLIIIGVVLAVFNATLAIVLQFSRVVYSTARDRAWPGALNRFLSQVNPRYKTPWGAVLAVGLLNTLLTFLSSVVAAITFTSVLIIVLYALIAVAAIVNRVKNPDPESRPWKMWLFPIPPIIALAGVGLALSQQKVSDLITVAAIFAAGVVYYFIYPARKSAFWKPGAQDRVEIEGASGA